MSVKLVTVDAGMFNVKARLGLNKEIMIKRSLIDYLENVNTDNGEVVVYNDKSYVIDDPSILCDYDFSKDREKTQILIYHAISQLVHEGDTINLVVGFPLNDWLNRDRRDQFKAMLMANKLIALEVNGKKFSFTIRDITVLPETSGYIFSNMELVQRDVVGVIDIGGANSQGCVYSNGKPIASKAFNSNRGMNYFTSEVRKTINAKFGTNYDDLLAAKLIEGHCNHVRSEEILDEIRIITEKYSKNILTELKAADWNITDMEIILTGGGSRRFYSVLKNEIKNLQISNSAITDNVTGFSIIGCEIYDSHISQF